MKVVVRRMGRPKSDVWQIIYMDLMTQIMMFFVILKSLEVSFGSAFQAGVLSIV